MKTLRSMVLLLCSASPIFAACAQQDAAAAAENTQASALLRPGLAGLADSLQVLRVDRWKMPQTARDEVQNNVASLHRDLDTTLPALLATADAKPSSLVNALPVSRNIGALYDVLLRILERARVAAPPDQAASLDRARMSLDQARRALDATLQTTAAAQEQALQRVQSAPAPAPACTPAPAKKKKLKS